MTTDEFGNGTVLTDIHDGIGLITLNRPEVRNALSSDVLEALPTAIRSLEASSDVDVLVLTGRDPAFCAGLDLGSWEIQAEISTQIHSPSQNNLFLNGLSP